MVSAVHLFIFEFDTFRMMERRMLGNSIQEIATVSSYLYLLMAASYFRQASRTRHSHLRNALRDSGRECLTNAHRVVPVQARPAKWTRSSHI
jgi:hypothetical protein